MGKEGWLTSRAGSQPPKEWLVVARALEMAAGRFGVCDGSCCATAGDALYGYCQVAAAQEALTGPIAATFASRLAAQGLAPGGGSRCDSAAARGGWAGEGAPVVEGRADWLKKLWVAEDEVVSPRVPVEVLEEAGFVWGPGHGGPLARWPWSPISRSSARIQ